MAKVYNRRDPKTPKDAIYVGRPTKYGNRYSHQRVTQAEVLVSTRDEAVDRYREDLLAMRESDPAWFAEFIRPLRGRNLVCWCAPAACHADVLLELANE